MRVVVTGAAGFIGSNLVDALIAKNYQVTAIDDLSYGLARYVSSEADFHAVDIRSPEVYSLCDGADAVIHMAALCDIPYCDAHPLETCDVNIMGTANIFQAAVKGRVRKVIYAETAAIYEGTNIRPTPESEFCPEYIYGATKACDHLLARAFKNAYGLTSVGLRFLGAYGPKQDYRRSSPALMSKIMLKLLRDEQPVLFEGDDHKCRDFIYVDDVVSFILSCLNDARADGQVFNVGSMEATPISDVINEIIAISGKAIRPKLMPAPPPGPQSLLSVLCDNTKARSLGWKPEIDLHEGLTRMWRFMESDTRKW